MKILINVGSKIKFNELPESLEFGTEGTVNRIDVLSNTVSVDVPSWGEVVFNLDGSSWSVCGEFKRETAFVS